MSTYNCSFSSRERELEPYADVAGPGVLAGYLGTAWICVVLVIVHYLLIFDPEQDPFQEEGLPGAGNNNRHWTANPIDALFKIMFERVSLSFSTVGQVPALQWMRRNPRLQAAFNKAILAMCDIQIVTGLGILVSGYADLKSGISAYHFLLVGLVAWFSNLTHIAGLTVLRHYLHRRPSQKWIRLSLMIILSVMLLTAMGPTVFFNWPVWESLSETAGEEEKRFQGSAGLPGSYAICFFNARRAIQWHYSDTEVKLEASPSFQSVLISMLLLVFSLASRTIKLQSTLSSAVKKTRGYFSNRYKAYIRRCFCIEPSFRRRKPRSRSTQFMRTIFCTQMTNLLVIRIYTDLLVSTLSDIYWLLISAIWGTIKLFLVKQSVVIEEDSWAFGQILPAFLLLAPLLTTMEIFTELRRGTDTSASQPDTSPGDNSPAGKMYLQKLADSSKLYKATSIATTTITKLAFGFSQP
ncbi:hypothetical protein B0T16DRAFT_489112 [Cercophora newfieldiana]|uniref:Uncharacterized protein n=1 Tax=Cercophora newfieldiana TaxID=92897 RepID=A0AA39YE68_9PEZI|nr:hypothetical protein B0T16DRAFT_489112 [Cercophora newfieldiana]